MEEDFAGVDDGSAVAIFWEHDTPWPAVCLCKDSQHGVCVMQHSTCSSLPGDVNIDEPRRHCDVISRNDASCLRCMLSLVVIVASQLTMRCPNPSRIGLAIAIPITAILLTPREDTQRITEEPGPTTHKLPFASTDKAKTKEEVARK